MQVKGLAELKKSSFLVYFILFDIVCTIFATVNYTLYQRNLFYSVETKIWVVPEDIHTPTEKINNHPLDILYKFKALFRLSGQQKFPLLWVGYGSCLE